MESGGKKGGGAKGHHGKPNPDARKDRKSATGMSGEPKKGGHGGKFTWSGDQRYSDEGEMNNAAVDAKDPNFEEEEEEEKLQTQ